MSVIYYLTNFYTEQVDAEGLGRKLLLTLLVTPRRAPEKQTIGTATASHKMLTLQVLSSSLNAPGTAKGGLPGPRRGFWVLSGSLSPRTTASIYTLPGKHEKFRANFGANFGANLGENFGNFVSNFAIFFRKLRSAEGRC